MEELALGSQIEPALHGLGERVPLIDLKFFITGLILQRQTGANMVAVLENLSALIRERLNMAAKMKAHTAQQRFSAGLLCSLPRGSSASSAACSSRNTSACCGPIPSAASS